METKNIQQQILSELRKSKGACTLITINGFHYKGTIKAHDNYTIVLSHQNKDNLIYKHAISTIIPEKAIEV